MELMAVPSVVLQYAELGEPLRDEEEVAYGARPRERAGHVRGPLHLDRRGAARRDRLRERNGHHRLVIRIAIVGRDEMARRGETGRRRADRARDGWSRSTQMDEVDVDV